MLPGLPLYLVVYYTIVYRIISRGYAVGDKLPSRSELAASFHTGEGTIRKALTLLAKQGYILIHSGSPPVVALDIGDPGVLEQMTPVLECRRGTLADIFNTYQFLLPSVIYWSVSKMNRPELLTLFKSICATLKASPDAFERLYLELIGHVLAKARNSSLCDYYLTTNLYMRLSTLTLGGNPEIMCSLLEVRCKLLRWFAARLRLSLTGREKIGRLHITAGIRWYINALVRILELDTEETACIKARSVFCNFEPKYMSVCLSVIEKIYAGQYRAGDFLPSDTTAAEEYGIAVLTARKAYKTLNKVGFTRTIPQVGTQVVFDAQNPSMRPYMLQNKGAQTRIGCFLDCLRFLKICIREAALYACRDLESLLADLLVLEKRGHPSAVFQMYNLICALDCIAKHTNSVNFYAYFSLIKPFLFFGAYPLLSEKTPQKDMDFSHEARQAFAHLKARETHAFAKCLENLLDQLVVRAEACYSGVKVRPQSLLFTMQFTDKTRDMGNENP